MAVCIIGMIIGIAVAAAGLFYRSKEKSDKEAVKIYSIASAVGAVIFIIMLAVMLFKLGIF